MPSTGQDVLLLTENAGLSDSAPSTGSGEVQYGQGIARGPSSVAVGDKTLLVADGLGQGGIEATLSGTLYISADNFYEVWLNGTYIGGRMGGDHLNWKDAESFSVAAQTGENVLAVKGYNSDGTNGPFVGEDTTNDSDAKIVWGILDDNGDVMAEPGGANVSDIKGTTSDPGSNWDEPDFSDTAWSSGIPVGSGAKSEFDAYDDSDFPDPLDPGYYWNPSAAAPNTQHVDVVWTRAYFTVQ